MNYPKCIFTHDFSYSLILLLTKNIKFQTTVKKNCDVVEQNGVYGFVTEVKCYRLTLVWFTPEIMTLKLCHSVFYECNKEIETLF